jgi:RNA polymerase sigma-B factor
MTSPDRTLVLNPQLRVRRSKQTPPNDGRSTTVSAGARGGSECAALAALFAQMTALPDGAPERERLKARIVTACLPVAENIAARYRGRGQCRDDLVQVASLGLMNALNRFDLAKGADFLSFAVPTMMGEVRRHFRERGWDVRVPRSLQEHYLELKKAQSSLTQCLGREPTVPELAAEVGVEPAEIGEIVAAGVSYNSTSLDAPASADGVCIGETLGEVDAALEAVDNHEILRSALRALPERERIIVLYRFFGQLTQSEIAEKVGLSQMHVSRLLSQSLQTLRAELTDTAARGGGPR